MIKIVIVEDEKPAVEKLKQLLAGTSEDIAILQVLESVEQSVNWFATNPSPDLIFLDVQLSDGICFEIFESVKIDVPVIFTTAYDAYAIRAFKVNSIDYLLKPIAPDLLSRAINKYRDHYHSDKTDRINHVISEMPVKFKSRFLVKTGEHFRSIAVSDIEAFFIQERATFMQTREGKTIDIDYSLEQLEKMVDPEDFFRANRNYLINIHFIKDMIGYSGSRIKVKMTHGNYPDTIIISRERVNAFKTRMDR